MGLGGTGEARSRFRVSTARNDVCAPCALADVRLIGIWGCRRRPSKWVGPPHTRPSPYPRRLPPQTLFSSGGSAPQTPLPFFLEASASKPPAFFVWGQTLVPVFPETGSLGMRILRSAGCCTAVLVGRPLTESGRPGSGLETPLRLGPCISGGPGTRVCPGLVYMLRTSRAD